MARAGPHPPPEGGGAAEVSIVDATVTPKTALPQGVTERQIVFTAHQSRVGQSIGAIVMGVDWPLQVRLLCAIMCFIFGHISGQTHAQALSRMVEREEYLDCLGARVEHPV